MISYEPAPHSLSSQRISLVENDDFGLHDPSPDELGPEMVVILMSGGWAIQKSFADINLFFFPLTRPSAT